MCGMRALESGGQRQCAADRVGMRHAADASRAGAAAQEPAASGAQAPPIGPSCRRCGRRTTSNNTDACTPPRPIESAMQGAACGEAGPSRPNVKINRSINRPADGLLFVAIDCKAQSRRLVGGWVVDSILFREEEETRPSRSARSGGGCQPLASVGSVWVGRFGSCSLFAIDSCDLWIRLRYLEDRIERLGALNGGMKGACGRGPRCRPSAIYRRASDGLLGGRFVWVGLWLFGWASKGLG